MAILLRIGLWASLGLYNYGLMTRSRSIEISLGFLLLLVAAITKRAQIPFSAWLPAAIAAPTPVSALVHSSTLVTAGVYLLIRFNYIITLSGYRNFILLLGLITMRIAGGAALFELDIKKIIALSTLSQLGVIFFRLGLSQPFVTFFHLISHAYFKAILFIAAGAIIHRVKEYQDIRKIGRATWNIPAIRRVILVRNLRLCGLPFLAGFYSKDLILEIFIIGDNSIIIFFLAILATVMTLIYSCRLILITFKSNRRREGFSHEGDSDLIMLLGMRFLISFSIIGGWFLRGVMNYNLLVYLCFWEKVFILCILLRVGFILFILESLNLNPQFYFLKFVHEIWFMPSLFSLVLTNNSLIISKEGIKITDFSWTPALTWGWMLKFIILNNYRNLIFRTNLIFRVLIIFLFIIIL